jgi:hypothetical protein
MARRSSTWAVVRGPKDRPIPAARELTERQARGAVRDRNQRPGMAGKGANWRVVRDSTLDSRPRGRGGLAGTGDAGTRAAKREEARKRAADRRRKR